MNLERMPPCNEDLVDKILAHIEFPDVLNLRWLSSEWQKKFSAHPDNAGFQHQVSTVCAKWKSFSPLIVDLLHGQFLGCHYAPHFDAAGPGTKSNAEAPAEPAAKWLTLDLDEGFREHVSPNMTTNLKGVSHLAAAGSILCAVLSSLKVTIINLITHEWKDLPMRDGESNFKVAAVHLQIDEKRDQYRVLLLTCNDAGSYVEYYASCAKTWTGRTLIDKHPFTHFSSVVFDWRLYVVEMPASMANPGTNPIVAFKIKSYDLLHNSSVEYSHSFTDQMPEDVKICQLLLSDATIFLLMSLKSGSWLMDATRTELNSVRIFKLNLPQLDVQEIVRGPPQTLEVPSSDFCLHNGIVYMGSAAKSDKSIISYDLKRRTWSVVPPPKDFISRHPIVRWCSTPFCPGVKPFLRI